MFPGANATVYRNEAGEPLGWDYPSDYLADWIDERDDYADDGWEPGDVDECVASGNHGVDCNGVGGEFDEDLNEHVGGTWECALCGEPVADPAAAWEEAKAIRANMRR